MAFPTLATHYDHQILGNEYCSGYTDLFGKWNTGFYCPQAGSSLAVYCCGTSVFKYCCTSKQSESYGSKGAGAGLDDDDDITSLYLSDTPVIIAIACGMAAVLILVIVASCFFCSCCFVYKKRLHVPGMYRMEDSSTTSGLASFQISTSQSQTQSQLPSTESNQTRPVPPREQYIMTSQNIIGSGSSDTSSSPTDAEWSQPHQSQPSHFHINNNRSSGISSNHCVNLLPPPARFASNQNLSSNTTTTGIPLIDRNNPRDILPHYQNQNQNQNFGAPYSLTSTPSSCQSSRTHQSYSTSTLPSCLRRAAATAGSGCGNPQQNQPQQLKSILRNPRNPNEFNNVTTYRRATTDYDFCDALLPLQNACYDPYDYDSYNNRPPQPSNETYHNYNRPFTPQGSINSGRYSAATPSATVTTVNPTSTEYQNDLNRFGQDLDPESLSRLIELDLDSKL